MSLTASWQNREHAFVHFLHLSDITLQHASAAKQDQVQFGNPLVRSCAEQEDGRQLAESFQERQHRIRVFDRDSVPWYFGVSLYTILLSIAAAGIPLVYPEVVLQLKQHASLMCIACAYVSRSDAATAWRMSHQHQELMLGSGNNLQIFIRYPEKL